MPNTLGAALLPLKAFEWENPGYDGSICLRALLKLSSHSQSGFADLWRWRERLMRRILRRVSSQKRREGEAGESVVGGSKPARKDA